MTLDPSIAIDANPVASPEWAKTVCEASSAITASRLQSLEFIVF
jgi:hypothetical protein